MRNMVISMAVILGITVVWLAMVPRVNPVSQPPLDVSAVAEQVVQETGWPILQPRGMPDGWRANAVRFVRSTDGLMTWHAGYVTPDEQYVSIEQTQGATQNWVDAETNRGRAEGTLVAAGRTWQKIVRQDKVQNSLVNRGTGPKDLTTVLSGTASFDQLVSFAQMLRPVPKTS